jgi:prolyl 4-hydroxylase
VTNNSESQIAFDLGFAHLQGRGVPRSLRLARENFREAADRGHPQAQDIHVAFLACGIGGERDWAGAIAKLKDAASMSDRKSAGQLALLEAMELTEEGDPKSLPPPERLSDRPEVIAFRAFLSPDECRYLIDAAAPAFQPAAVGHVAGGMGGHVVPRIRTCDVAAFPWVAENPVIHAINRRIAAASGTAADWGEPLQILRYRPGQEFKPHRDCTEDIENQRVWTMLIYLNDGYTGGETEFLQTGLKVRGNTGDALLFRNADDAGRPDMSTLHAGLPVFTGKKLLASRWIRQKRYGPVD